MVAAPMPSRDFSKIPSKLKGYNQWIVWKLEVKDGRQTKIPYSAHNGYQASVTNPNHWSSFNQAQDALDSGHYSGLGFVLSENDPFVFIDLDDPGEDAQLRAMHAKIIEHFQSYAERSPSGTGTHIICEGLIEDGKRSAANAAEMYATARYMTMTGDAINSYGITNQQALVEILYAQLDHARSKPKLVVDNSVGKFENQEQLRSDEDVVASALNAQNGELFRALYIGGWEEIKRYQHSNGQPNQSAADQALFNFAGFHSKNAEQIVRIFHASILGKRKKAFRRDYILHMLDNSADWKVPTMEISIPSFDSVYKEAGESSTATAPSPASVAAIGKGNQPEAPEPASHAFALQSTPLHLLKPPPGLLGEVATYIYQSAPLPVPQIALAGAIGFMAGMCGRAFNVSGTGLNQYVLLLAETGRGKEGMKAGIRRLIASMEMSMPNARDIIGPGRINSGQSLGPYIEGHNTRCFVSIQSEFDSSYSQMIAKFANGAMQTLKSQYLDLYMASGKDASIDPSIYSDKKKSIAAVRSPSFTLLAECTLTHMNKILNEDQISDGLLTRFLNIVYDGEQVEPNENAGFAPDVNFIKRLCYLYNTCLQVMNRQDVINVQLDTQADEIFRKFRSKARNHVNNKEKIQYAALWNRAHLKSLKLAALIAASNCAHSGNVPVIDAEAAEWAISMIEYDILNIVGRFEMHEVGDQSNELAQMRDLKKTLLLYPKLTASQRHTGRISDKMFAAKVVTKKWISSRVCPLASFKNDKYGASKALDKMLKILEDEGALYDIRKDPKCREKYNTFSCCYLFTDFEALGV